MRDADFRRCLTFDPAIISKNYAVGSRLSRAPANESYFNISLDSIVADDDTMYLTLLRIKQEMNEHNGNISNALRKYYHFANGVDFPPLDQYQLKRERWSN